MPNILYEEFIKRCTTAPRPQIKSSTIRQNKLQPKISSSGERTAPSIVNQDPQILEEKKEHATKDIDPMLAVIITALSKEMKEVTKLYNKEWFEHFADGISYRICSFQVNNQQFSIAVCCTGEMGMVPAAIYATKAIRTWAPKYVAMVGICAGYKGRTSIGDVIVAEQVFDHGAGKMKNGKLQPDFATILMHGQEHARLKAFVNDFRPHRIKEAWPVQEVGMPQHDLSIRIGCMASGAAVIADAKILEGIEEHKRKIYGIDMEAYGVARAAYGESVTFVIAKAVSDHADENKDNTYQTFACFASAFFVREFLHHRAQVGL